MKLATIALASVLALSASSAFAQAGDGGGTGVESAQIPDSYYGSYGRRGFAGANDAWIYQWSHDSWRGEGRHRSKKYHH